MDVVWCHLDRTWLKVQLFLLRWVHVQAFKNQNSFGLIDFDSDPSHNFKSSWLILLFLDFKLVHVSSVNFEIFVVLLVKLETPSAVSIFYHLSEKSLDQDDFALKGKI